MAKRTYGKTPPCALNDPLSFHRKEGVVGSIPTEGLGGSPLLAGDARTQATTSWAGGALIETSWNPRSRPRALHRLSPLLAVGRDRCAPECACRRFLAGRTIASTASGTGPPPGSASSVRRATEAAPLLEQLAHLSVLIAGDRIVAKRSSGGS
jgi:hypothetical protein